jgi:hypothetical protein
MRVEIFDDICVRADNLLHVLWVDITFDPARGTGHKAANIKFIAIELKTSEGLGVVGLVGNVRSDEDAWLRTLSGDVDEPL